MARIHTTKDFHSDFIFSGYVLPEGPMPETPKLQQAWKDYSSADIEWRDVPTETISNEDFFGRIA